MAVERTYYCSECGTQTEREMLTVKKAAFFEMGVGGRAVRSRVVGHLCPQCLVKDEDFKRPAFETPGTKPMMRPQ